MSMKLHAPLSSRGNENKMEVDIVILGGWVLTLDNAKTTYNPGFVAIKDHYIVDAGFSTAYCASKYNPKTIIDATNCLVMPGLINTHTHAAMTLFRGYADDMPLKEWLFDHIFPAEAKHVNESLVYQGTRLAIAEMLKNGITTFCDGYFFCSAVAEAVSECGIRAVVGQGILDYPTPDTQDPSSNYTTAVKFIEKYHRFSDRVYPSIFCHSPYTCSDETLIRMKELCASEGVLFQIHLSETENEASEFEGEKNTRPTFHLKNLGILDSRMLVAHAVWLNEEEIQVLKESGAGVSHVVSSNMKLAAGVAPLPRYLETGINVGIGTDGCASNNRLDLLRDMDLTAKIHKVWSADPTVVQAFSVVEMATRRGAAAIGLGKKTGSIEKGKLADLIVLSMEAPHLAPVYDPYSHLVYCAKGSDVRDVIVNGKIVVRERQILSFDEMEVMEKVSEVSSRIKNSQIRVGESK